MYTVGDWECLHVFVDEWTCSHIQIECMCKKIPKHTQKQLVKLPNNTRAQKNKSYQSSTKKFRCQCIKKVVIWFLRHCLLRVCCLLIVIIGNTKEKNSIEKLNKSEKNDQRNFPEIFFTAETLPLGFSSYRAERHKGETQCFVFFESESELKRTENGRQVRWIANFCGIHSSIDDAKRKY